MASVRKPRENLCASEFHPSKIKNRAPKVGGFAAHFACGFFEFWRGGTRSRIVSLEVFARRPLILSDDNTNKSQKNDFSCPTPNRHHSISFVKTNAPGGVPVVRDRRFDLFFEKNTFFSDDYQKRLR